ncbi:unnamed protein product [Polarella glacialis]|uniref:Cellulase n=1 Tax=Polarella glacialis TaxID=89957 RepID=A0A813LYF8_POLGL|nr:unnamed protein product [Polarella glacialis]
MTCLRLWCSRVLLVLPLRLEVAETGSSIDCTLGYPEEWPADKQYHCCYNPPRICAPYTHGCNAPCLYQNISATCRVRMHFKKKFAFSKERHEICLKAFYMVRDECPVCHKCTALDAGCSSHDRDCSGDPEKDKWSDETKEFCCLKQGIACPASPTTTQVPLVPYDCFNNLWYGAPTWSSAQKHWCCEHQKQGCEGVATKDPPDQRTSIPDADFQVFLDAIAKAGPSFSQGKYGDLPSKVTGGQEAEAEPYGKRHFDVTGGLQHPESYDCIAGQANWHLGWSEEKKKWCCARENVGCETQEKGSHDSHDYFDCEADVANWRNAWAPQQQTWCCRRVGVGCPTDEDNGGLEGMGGLEEMGGLEDTGHSRFDEAKDQGPGEDNFFFDCSKGYASTWSTQKRSVCCLAANANCD